MKKQRLSILLILALLLTMTGCSAAGALEKLDTAEDTAEILLEAAEDKLEDSLRNAVAPAPAAVPAAPTIPAAPTVPPEPVTPAAPTVPAAPVLPEPAPQEPTGQLTEAQALQVALDHLGFSADQVSRQRTEYEIDDRIPQFDIEFHQGDWEYEFEIHAENGQILSYDKDHKYD